MKAHEKRFSYQGPPCDAHWHTYETQEYEDMHGDLHQARFSYRHTCAAPPEDHSSMQHVCRCGSTMRRY